VNSSPTEGEGTTWTLMYGTDINNIRDEQNNV
jgi:hypothetical protein